MQGSSAPSADVKATIQWLMATMKMPETNFKPAKSDVGFKSFKTFSEEGDGEVVLKSTMEFPSMTPDEVFTMMTDFEIRK